MFFLIYMSNYSKKNIIGIFVKNRMCPQFFYTKAKNFPAAHNDLKFLHSTIVAPN